LEASRHLLPTIVQEEAEFDGNVEVDAEDVGFERSAEADGGLEVGEVSEQQAARDLGRLADFEVDEAEDVRAHAELEGIDRALARPGRRGLGARPGLRGLRCWARAT